MKPLKVYVTYEETHAEVISNDEGDGSPYSGYRSDRYDYELKSAYLICPKDITPCWDEFVIKVEEVPVRINVLYARYSTGDTFSDSTGHGRIVGVYVKLADAERDKKKIEEGEWTGYSAWDGYFESLESVHIEPMTVYG